MWASIQADLPPILAILSALACVRPLQGPLQPLAEAIKSTLNAAGEALERLGQRTFGGHILAFVDARKAAG